MPSFYQVYNTDEVLQTDLAYANPTTLDNAFSQAAQLEAKAWCFEDEHLRFTEQYEPSDREAYTVQPSPWGYEEVSHV